MDKNTAQDQNLQMHAQDGIKASPLMNQQIVSADQTSTVPSTSDDLKAGTDINNVSNSGNSVQPTIQPQVGDSGSRPERASYVPISQSSGQLQSKVAENPERIGYQEDSMVGSVPKDDNLVERESSDIYSMWDMKYRDSVLFMVAGGALGAVISVIVGVILKDYSFIGFGFGIGGVLGFIVGYLSDRARF